MKNILFITSRYLWPIDSGRKMSLDYYCKGLHEKFGYDIYLYCFLEKGQNFDGSFPSYIKKVYISDQISYTEKIKNILLYSVGPRQWPIQCSLYYGKNNEHRINDICKILKPDVVITEMIRTASYINAFKDFTKTSIANLDDLLSKRYKRQINSKDSTANFMGIYAEKLPSPLIKVLQHAFLKKILLQTESKLCEKWEKKYYELYDYIMLTSSKEVDEMNGTMRDNKAITLSVGVDNSFFVNHVYYKSSKVKNSMSYVGNFKVSANYDTLKMICEKILPWIKHDFTFYVIGSCPQDVREWFSSNQNIIFTGRVENVTEFVSKTDVFLSPIAYGTGIKTKIIEAMAMGMPVITNDVGAEGITAENNKHFFVANGYKEIAELVDIIFDHPQLREYVGENARAFAYDNYRLDVVYKAFEIAGL